MIITGNIFFTDRLKHSSEDNAFVSLGSTLHSFGAELEKDPSKRDILDLGTDKKPSVADRKFQLQSTLVISNSKGLTETLRDIRTSTYQSWESEENNKLNNHIKQMNM